MNEPSYTGTLRGCWIVTEELNGCHPIHKDYPLLPGDVLLARDDGWYKFGPGLGITGFVLSEEQIATLQRDITEQHFGIGGMDFFLDNLAPPKAEA